MDKGMCLYFRIMAHLLIIAAGLNQRKLPKPRVFRDRTQPLDSLDDDELISRYRLNRQCIVDLCDLLASDLERCTNRSSALSVSTQVLVALRYFATGSFQRVDGDLHGVSQSSVSRSVNAVAKAVSRHASQFIKFPTDEASQRRIKAEFYDLAGFPNVLGCVDGTQIPILAPKVNEHVYVCRKGFHSLNVQGICDAKLRFLNIVTKYPGSTHDAFIWRECAVCSYMATNDNGWLLGDSGYPLSPFLMTPVINATTAADQAYNKRHSKTRNTIERAFGLLKMRFRCLHKTGGCLQSPPTGCVHIICTCAVLHNICIDNHVPAPSADVEIEDNDDLPPPATTNNDNGARIRSRLIERRFTEQ